MKKLFCTLLLAFSFTTQAAVINAPLGTLSDGNTFFGTVIGDDDSFAASLGDYWIFDGMAGDMIDIDINRTEAAPDLIATLFLGDVTGLDVDLLSPNGLIDGFLTSSGTFGALTAIDVEDDTENDAFGGPFGDPRFILALPSTGTYTLLVATLNAPGSYEITTNGISAAAEVPAPAALTVLLLGFAGVFVSRRNKA